MSDWSDSGMERDENGEYIFYDTTPEGSENENDEDENDNVKVEATVEAKATEEVEATQDVKATEEVIHQSSAEDSSQYSMCAPPNRLHREKQMPRADLIEIPKKFVQWNTKCTSVSEDILGGSYLRCLGGELMSPSSFFVNLTQSWNTLEVFMEQVQDRMSKFKGHPLYDSLTPNSFTLIPGQHVLAFCKTSKEKEWHRGIIIGKISHTSFYLVKLTDYGTQIRVPIEHIKYMFKEYLTEFPVQAIQCRLKFSQDIPEDFEWSQEAKKRFRELLVHKMFGVTFHERTIHFSKELKRNYSVWSVTVHVMDGCAESYCDPSIKLGQPIKHRREDEHHGEYIKTVAEFDISQQLKKYLLHQ